MKHDTQHIELNFKKLRTHGLKQRYVIEYPYIIVRNLIINSFRHLLLSLNNYKYQNAVIVISETRSGSTWLMEMLLSDRRLIPCWEPLHPKFGVVPSSYRFGDRPYIPSNEKSNNYNRLFEGMFACKIFNKWTTSYAKLSRIITGEMVLVKFVRATLLLPWIVNNIELSRKPILLLRHPIAVAMSQIKNFRNESDFRDTQIPDWINNERFVLHYDYLNSLKSPLEFEVAKWCINNISTILDENFNRKWIVVYYENLVHNADLELDRLKDELHLEISLANVQKNKPSHSSKKSRNHFMNKDQVTSFLDHLDTEELSSIQNVFDHFHFKLYNAYEPFPQDAS